MDQADAAQSRTNLHRLHVFEVVAQRGSFSLAAQELHISQPAVSGHVKELERAFGLPLFERVGRGAQLTQAGQQLHEYCRRLFALLREMFQVMEKTRAGEAGSLRVAADTTAGVYVVPKYLGTFRRIHPAVVVSLEVTNRANVIHRLLLEEVDLAVMGQVPDEETLLAWPFLTNELVVIAPREHRLAGRAAVPVEELAAETFLIREEGSGTRATTERFFASAGVPLRIGMELGSNSAIKQAVANDLGIAVISRHAVLLEVEVGRLVILDVHGFPLLRHWHVVHGRQKRLSPVAAGFKASLLDPGQTIDGH